MGLPASSLSSERPARRLPRRTLITSGFVVSIAGVVVLIILTESFSTAWAFVPGCSS